jgi:CDP-diglyceride synthetase
MKKRLLTGSIILLAYIVVLFSARYTPYVFDLFIGLIAIMGCVEVSRVLERKKVFTNIIFIGCFPAILYIAMSVGIYNERGWMHYLAYFIGVLLSLFLINFLYTIIFKTNTLKEKKKYNVQDLSNTKYAFTKCMNSTFVMIYPAILFCAFFMINHFYDFAFVDVTGLEDTKLLILFFLVLTFVITIVTDSMAYVVGSGIKGPKLCPLISPNKTISGALGGLLFGAISALVTYYLFSLNNVFEIMIQFLDITWWKILIIGIVVSIIGQIGDIVASALKRSARVKDYGTIFPGHGGVMDRVDGLIFNAGAMLICMFILL